MPSDLSYFKESDLNNSNICDFHRRLPSHLQDIFSASMGGINALYRGGISNVLQGYRGPHTDGSSGDSAHLSPLNGLQEVKYWWGTSKYINCMPIGGTVGFVVGRWIGDTDWHSVYFDSKTEECLSHDKEIAASILNDKGNDLLNNGNFNQAKEYFSNAYYHSNNSTQRSAYGANKDNAQAEIDAELLNSEGNTLFNQGNYSEAKQKYQDAYNKSRVEIAFQKYCSNKNIAQVEVDAELLNNEGNTLFNQGKYPEAKQKYQAAYDKSRTEIAKQQYDANRKKAQVEIDALKLYYEGNKFFGEGKYWEAKQKYEAAHEISKVENALVKYKVKIKKTQCEIDSIRIKEQGDQEFKLGKYENALIKYQDAINLSTVDKNKGELKECINKTKSKKYDMLLDEFDSILKENCSVEKLKEFAIKLEKMIDEGYGNDAQIVNRYHIMQLRIARLNMISQLEATDRSDRIEKIIILIQTELKVLKELNIQDENLEKELKDFYDQLTEHEENTNENEEVNITKIGVRVCVIGQELENTASERLDQVMHQQS